MDKCPRCGSPDLSSFEVDVEKGIYYNGYDCYHCDWTEGRDEARDRRVEAMKVEFDRRAWGLRAPHGAKRET